MRSRLRGFPAWWLLTASGIAVAIVVALTAPGRSPAVPDDQALRAAIFREIATSESAVRGDAARAFPGDPWSADDDFHNHEQRAARAIAARDQVPVETVLRAIDDGLREHWAHANPGPLVVTVPPCHPRPVY
ncbi:MAG TPA: hypothetical protein VLT58_14650 [Polyangia bacterium]|nr:hypothetical protein [Polyangia bacterium]